MFFLGLVRPSQAKFGPVNDVMECLNCHRNADDMRGRNVVQSIDGNRYLNVWSVLGIVMQ